MPAPSTKYKNFPTLRNLRELYFKTQSIPFHFSKIKVDGLKLHCLMTSTWIFFPEKLNTVKEVSTTAWAHHPSTTASNLQCLPLTLGQCDLPRTWCTSAWACYIWNYSGHVVNRILNQHVIQLMQETGKDKYIFNQVFISFPMWRLVAAFVIILMQLGSLIIQFKTMSFITSGERSYLRHN